MTYRQRIAFYGGCAFLAILWSLQLSGCAKVGQMTNALNDDIAYDRANKALASDNPAEAAAQYRVAAEAGHAQAQYQLGLMAANGTGMAKNKTEALKWMRLSAEKGYAPAERLLGTWYYAGGIAPHDPAEAGRWFRKAAAQQDAGAMYFLGMMHARGEGVTKDKDAALSWFRQAAAKGFSVPPEQLTKAGVEGIGRKSQAGRAASAETAPSAARGRPASVRDVQEGLTKLGYDPGPADGIMGKKTVSAIKAFQQDNKLPADGKVSEELMRRIKEKIGE